MLLRKLVFGYAEKRIIQKYINDNHATMCAAGQEKTLGKAALFHFLLYLRGN